jgi:hypothetical protein
MKTKGCLHYLIENVAILYILFIAMILQLGYFILLKDTRSIVIFCLTAIFVYLVIPNMIIVLAVSLAFVDMLYFVNRTYEGFTDSISILKNGPPIDASMNEADKFIERSIKQFQDATNINDPPSSGNILKEVDENSKKFQHLLDTINTATPEMADTIKKFNSIDIPELNKLINNLTDISQSFKN